MTEEYLTTEQLRTDALAGVVNFITMTRRNAEAHRYTVRQYDDQFRILQQLAGDYMRLSVWVRPDVWNHMPFPIYLSSIKEAVWQIGNALMEWAVR
jgi:hypothetical protein